MSRSPTDKIRQWSGLLAMSIASLDAWEKIGDEIAASYHRNMIPIYRKFHARALVEYQNDSTA